MSFVVGFVESTPDLVMTVGAICPQPGLGVTSEVAQLLALRHGLPISTWKKKSLGFSVSSVGSGVGGERSGCFRWVACAKQNRAQCFFRLHEQTLLKSVWILVETALLIFPLLFLW